MTMSSDATVYADWWEVLLHVAADASRSSVIFDSNEEFPLLSRLIYDADPSHSRHRGRAGAYAGDHRVFPEERLSHHPAAPPAKGLRRNPRSTRR